MSVNLRLRIAILERDGYRCVYCGATPARVHLQVDHVVPRSRGGTDEPTNLVTSCRECNQGKSDRSFVLPDGYEPGPVDLAWPSRVRRPATVLEQGRAFKKRIWPIQTGTHRGWPLPDGSWDQLCVEQHEDGFLPWAVWQVSPDWYVGFYTCDQGHAWTCGYGLVSGWSRISHYRVSPIHKMPDRGYLKIQLGVQRPEDIKAVVMQYPPDVPASGPSVPVSAWRV